MARLNVNRARPSPSSLQARDDGGDSRGIKPKLKNVSVLMIAVVAILLLALGYVFWGVAGAFEEPNSAAGACPAYVEEVAGYLTHKHMQWLPEPLDSDCSPNHRFSSTEPLACENKGASSGSSCGGIPLTPGACLWHLHGHFLHHPEADVQAPQKLWGGEPEPHAHHTLCGHVNSVDGFAVGLGDDQTWQTFSGCELAPLDLGSLLRVTMEGPVVFMGGPHTRDQFTAMVAGLRGMKHFAVGNLYEKAAQHGAAMVYTIRGTVSPPQAGWNAPPVVNLTDSWELVLNLDSHSHSLYLDCNASLTASGSVCMQVVNIWAPHASDKLLWIPELELMSPSLLVLAPQGQSEEVAPFPTTLQTALGRMLDTPRPFTLVLAQFPWEQTLAVLRWYSKAHPGSHFLPFTSTMSNMFYTEQAERTGHRYACGIINDHTAPPWAVTKIKVYATGCPDLFDTAVDRIFLTLALAKLHGQSVTGE